MSDVDDFLAHYGVKGMKWGVKRGSDGVRPIARTLSRSKFGKKSVERARNHSSKKMSPETKELVKGLITTAALVGVNIAVRKGAMWAVNNPEKIAVFMQRAQNTMNGTKAIGVGYEVIKIASG